VITAIAAVVIIGVVLWLMSGSGVPPAPQQQTAAAEPAAQQAVVSTEATPEQFSQAPASTPYSVPSTPRATPQPTTEAEPSPVPRQTAANSSGSSTLEWARIPGGSFQMGCTSGDSECASAEKPQHQVSVSGFWMNKTEVTVGAFQRFATANGRSMPSDQAGSNHPVVNVDWNDAEAFCSWAGGRLPSEAEWEYAARGGREGSKYPWGNSISHEEANYGEDQCCAGLASGRDQWVNTSPVGSFSANGFGLYDMAGNVWEWVGDAWHEGYSGAPSDGSPWTSGGDQSRRVLRGGSWFNDPRLLRVSGRSRVDTGYRFDNFGFRCARDASP